MATASQRRGSLFAPIHWTAATAGRRARRRADPCVGRSGLRPARFQSDAGDDRAEPGRRRRLSRLASARRAARMARPCADRRSRRRGDDLRLGRAPGGAAGLPVELARPRRYADAGAPTKAPNASSPASFADGRLEILLHVAPKLDRAALDAAIALLALSTIDARGAPLRARRPDAGGRRLGEPAGLRLLRRAARRDRSGDRRRRGERRSGRPRDARRNQLRLVPGRNSPARGSRGAVDGDCRRTEETEMFAKTLDDFAAIAAAKAAFSRDKPLAFFVSSMMAGAYVGIGIILIFTLGQQIEPALRSLVMGACFGIALTLVVFAGSDLFTGHTMFMTIGLARGTVDGVGGVRAWVLTLDRQSRRLGRCWRWSSGSAAAVRSSRRAPI